MFLDNTVGKVTWHTHDHYSVSPPDSSWYTIKTICVRIWSSSSSTAQSTGCGTNIASQSVLYVCDHVLIWRVTFSCARPPKSRYFSNGVCTELDTLPPPYILLLSPYLQNFSCGAKPSFFGMIAPDLESVHSVATPTSLCMTFLITINSIFVGIPLT